MTNSQSAFALPPLGFSQFSCFVPFFFQEYFICETKKLIHGFSIQIHSASLHCWPSFLLPLQTVLTAPFARSFVQYLFFKQWHELKVYANKNGVELIGDYCTVGCNKIEDSSGYGLYCFGEYNEIFNNTIKSSVDYGIKMDNSPTTPCNNNRLYGNNLVNNAPGLSKQAYDSGSNTWRSSSQMTYCYLGSYYTNYIGNYWSDYTGTDDYHGSKQDIPGGDNIGDAPYRFSWGKDNYPLIFIF